LTSRTESLGLIDEEAAKTKSGLPRTKFPIESFSPHGTKTKSELDMGASGKLESRETPKSALISPERVPGPKSDVATLETSEPSVPGREAKPASMAPAATVSETNSMISSSSREEGIAVEKGEQDILLLFANNKQTLNLKTLKIFRIPDTV
jgi:hypothetical protein